MDLGSTIKKLRKTRNQTQHEFAERCCISQTYLSQIESNLKDPNLSTLKVISQHLEIPLPFLFFLSVSEDDISVEKREAFKMIGPSVKAFVNELFRI